MEYWTEEIRENRIDRVFESIRSAENLRIFLSYIHDDVDRRILQTADIIDIITTGLAKRISTLKYIKCKIMICEETDKIMKPYILSALLSNVEHFIQIGNYQ
jgi:hypothetical protein